MLFLSAGVGVYRNFYPEEKERMNGVVAIRVVKPVEQPYAALAGVLSVSFLTATETLKALTSFHYPPSHEVSFMVLF